MTLPMYVDNKIHDKWSVYEGSYGY
jgi:hypothetical protein